ncbi:MAG: helix-turn-helix transcriptional regulator [Clostridia bacterium]|nr:helix-turn-helix transcriptional regulator [Clostridia bacterium]
MQYTLVSDKVSYYSPVYLGNTERLTFSDKAYTLSTDTITSLHFHRCLEIGICVKGRGTCIIENRAYSYSAGDIQVVLPFQPHLSNGDPDDPGCWKYLSFDPYKGLVDGDTTLCSLIEKDVHFSGVFSKTEYPQLTEIIEHCIAEYDQNNKHAHRYASLLLQQLILELSRIPFPQNNGIRARKKSFAKLLPALEFISTHIADSHTLTLPNLAKQCFVSTATLRRYFYTFTDMSPQQFITQARLNFAEYLLHHTDHSIAEVACEAGFDTLSCFTRAFKRHYGVAPSVYRKSDEE